MLTINVYFNPNEDSIDMELTDKRMELISESFKYPLCRRNPADDSELGYKASDGKDFAAPIRFCCIQYQQTIMKELNEFLLKHPI